MSIIDVLDFTEYRFDLNDGLYSPIANCEPIAPDAVIEMVSCKSCKLCNTGRCPCYQSRQTCTYFCGCSDCCENTDGPMPENVMDNEASGDVSTETEAATEDGKMKKGNTGPLTLV